MVFGESSMRTLRHYNRKGIWRKLRTKRHRQCHVAVLIVFVVSALSCTEPPPRTLTLAERKLADSLFQEEVKLLKLRLDSLCDLRFDSMVRFALDSMLSVRKELMKKQLERLHRELKENEK